MKKLSTIHILCLVLSGILLLAVIPWPYGYYMLVRIVAMVVFGILTYYFYSNKQITFAIVSAILAILFQPFVKIAMGREVWQVLDVIIGILLIVYVYTDNKNGANNSSN